VRRRRGLRAGIGAERERGDEDQEDVSSHLSPFCLQKSPAIARIPASGKRHPWMHRP
jgi:hypothetical protein